MKKIAFLFLLFVSCELPPKRPVTKDIDNQQVSTVPGNFSYNVIVIDSCEYLEYGGAHGYLEITHKGNCRNKIHQCK